MSKKIAVFRKEHFNAAHRLFNPDWDMQKNDEVFGKIMDLGEYWEQQTGLPIPLGGIAVKRNLTAEIQLRINNLIKKSIEHAFNNYPNISDYVKQHAQEMQEQIMRQHIDLYVNNYSMDLGEDGKKAVNKMLQTYQQMHPQHPVNFESVFSDS